MAKTKKTSAASTAPAQPAAPATAPAHVPAFDTANAAHAAAAIVAHKHAGPPASAAGSAPAESSAFKNLKDALNKPHLAALGNMLDKSTPAGQKKAGPSFAFGKQVGHNQTFGADVNRRSVPRRTAG